MKQSAIVLGCLLTAAASHTNAEVITVHFSGTVPVLPGHLIDADFTDGDTVVGTLQFESTATDLFSDTDLGVYSVGITSSYLQIESATASSQSDVAVIVDRQTGGSDNYPDSDVILTNQHLDSIGTSTQFIGTFGSNYFDFGLRSDFPTGTFTDDSLVDNLYRIDTGGVTRLELRYRDGNTPLESLFIVIDPENISVVPEPSSLALLGFGAVAATRRRRSQ